jgi:hypothetical protein
LGITESILRGQSFLKENTLLIDLLNRNFNILSSLTKTLSSNLLLPYASGFILTDGIILIFGILGIAKTFTKSRIIKILIFYLLSYFLFGSLFFVLALRHFLPFTVLIIPFAAYGIYHSIGSRKILIFLIFLIASINSLWWDWLYFQMPTFIQVHNWVNENIPTSIPIAYIGGRYQTFVPSISAIKQLQKVNPNLYSRLSTFLPNETFDNVRNIIYISNFPGKTKEEKLKNATNTYPVAYVIDYYLDPKERLYTSNSNIFDLVVHFNPTRSGEIVYIPETLFEASSNFPTYDNSIDISMYSIVRTGPYIDILEMKNY